jgi:(R)-2-hydroxyacyl-CoA dehydratese activating ATPase
MIVAGCDVGSLTAKAVIMEDGKIAASAVIRVKTAPEDSAREVMGQALASLNASIGDIYHCVGTGYGRKQIPFVNGIESEIVCHARGAVWQVPTARTVIDIGGQDAKAIRVGVSGEVTRFIYNDKCASGTGRFLEIIAEALDVRLEDLGDIASKSGSSITLSSQCVVFAETEIISLINEGAEIPDIIKALHGAVANRTAALARGIVVENDVVMTGGVARNSGMFAALEATLGVSLKRVDNPQINGAIGAALIAAERA